jgi:hypothetical protein
MIEKIEEPIEVLSRFVDGKLEPMRFRWRGRVLTVTEVAGSWIQQAGDSRVHYFSVATGTRETYEICFRPRTYRWVLQTVYRT